MKTALVWVLLSAISLWGGCDSKSTEDVTVNDIKNLREKPDKIFGFESAKMIMKLPKETGNRILYIDNWGNTIVQIDIGHAMENIAYRYTYMNGESTYWQETPQGATHIIKRRDETPDNVRIKTATNDKLEGMSVKELQASGFIQLANEEIAGFPCEVFYSEMLKLKVWRWKDIDLKSESLLIENDTVVTEVLSLETDITIPAELLKVPDAE